MPPLLILEALLPGWARRAYARAYAAGLNLAEAVRARIEVFRLLRAWQQVGRQRPAQTEPPPPTGFDRFLAEQMKVPGFREGYERMRAKIEAMPPEERRKLWRRVRELDEVPLDDDEREMVARWTKGGRS